MFNDTLYVYGVVQCDLDVDWQENGIAEKNVYSIGEGRFSALVHDGEEKAYASENTEEIKGMILSHNKILDRAMEDFGGVLPLSFNTIIKGGTNSAQVNLKKWLHDDQERLERIWNNVKGKKEYGVRIYYDKETLLREASLHTEVKKIENDAEGKGEGLRYLLQGKAKSKMQEILQESVTKRKQEFFEGIKKITKKVVNNHSRIALEEEKDLLVSLSVLLEGKEIENVKDFLEKRTGDFPFRIAGPFAPYSFVEMEDNENGKQ